MTYQKILDGVDYDLLEKIRNDIARDINTPHPIPKKQRSKHTRNKLKRKKRSI